MGSDGFKMVEWTRCGLRYHRRSRLLISGRAAGEEEKTYCEFAIENAQVVVRRQERETKARERSKTVADKIEKGFASNTQEGTWQRCSDGENTGKEKRAEEPRTGGASTSKQTQSFTKENPNGGRPVETGELQNDSRLSPRKG
jgi:nucleolar protein 4